jgi:hypothetical protein
MLFFIVVISYSLKYIYLRVYLLILEHVELYSFIATWVFSVKCKYCVVLYNIFVVSFISFVNCLPFYLCVLFTQLM